MPDNADTPPESSTDMPESAEPGGFMLYVAIGLIAVLVILVFVINPLGTSSSPATALTENAWSLSSFAGPDETVVPPENGTVILAIFTPTGKLEGARSCPPYSARYMVQETAIVISRISRGSAGCPQANVTPQDLRYSQALEDAAFLRVSNQKLTLFDTAGKPLLTFVPARP